jgi:ribosomal protein S18 acetylase RimI-like enzyme
MSIEIRIVGSQDAEILNHVAPDVFDDPIVPRGVQEFLGSPDHHLAVAIEKGVVVGFASAVQYVHPDKPWPELWINEVGVAPSHQNRGVGRAIMQALLEVARNAGCAEAWVLTERQNLPAMRLYKAAGGEQEQDDIVMFTFKLDTVKG